VGEDAAILGVSLEDVVCLLLADYQQNELALLHRGFVIAARSGKVGVPMFPTISVDNARAGFVERGPFECLLRNAPPYLRVALLFLYVTGWRRSEVLGLKWSQVDFDHGVVRLEPGTTKNRKGREFPFGEMPELGRALREQREWTHGIEHARGMLVPWVFHKNGKRMKNFRKAWTKVCEKCGLIPGRAGLVPHDFRRSTVRNLERARVERSTAMKLTGHLTESVYSRYAISNHADLARGVSRLAKLLSEDGRDVDQVVLPFARRRISR
jgi:integrase